MLPPTPPSTSSFPLVPWLRSGEVVRTRPASAKRSRRHASASSMRSPAGLANSATQRQLGPDRRGRRPQRDRVTIGHRHQRPERHPPARGIPPHRARRGHHRSSGLTPLNEQRWQLPVPHVVCAGGSSMAGRLTLLGVLGLSTPPRPRRPRGRHRERRRGRPRPIRGRGRRYPWCPRSRSGRSAPGSLSGARPGR